MTIRDWFAGQALRTMKLDDETGRMIYEDYAAAAGTAYAFADAMLAARKKVQE